MLLPNGNVFVTGGLGSSSPFLSLSSAEMYDPVSGRWTANGSMATNRLGSVTVPHATVGRPGHGRRRLIGERVRLVPNGPQVEIYHPSTGTWSPTGSMSVGRAGGTFSLLSDGRILAAGGSDTTQATHSSAELWDPTSGTWSMTASLLTARASPAAAVLADGRVLAVGGYDAVNYFTSAELYVPAVFSVNLALLKTDPQGPGADRAEPDVHRHGYERWTRDRLLGDGDRYASGKRHVRLGNSIAGKLRSCRGDRDLRPGIDRQRRCCHGGHRGEADRRRGVHQHRVGSNLVGRSFRGEQRGLTTACRITSRPTSIPCP